MNNEKKFQELISDEKFMSEILSMDSIEQIQGGFATKGIDMSKDEVEGFVEIVEKISDNTEALSENDLEKIAGGKLSEKAKMALSFFGGAVSTIATLSIAGVIINRKKKAAQQNAQESETSDYSISY